MKAYMVRTIGLLVATVSATAANGATIARWDFNATTNVNNPSVGTGTRLFAVSNGAALTNGSGILGTLTSLSNGSPGDPAAAPNNRDTRLFPQAAAASSSANRGWQVTSSTLWKQDITFSFNLSIGYRASRFYQIYATTDGINYAPVPTGTGINPTVLGAGSQTSTLATVSNSGLIEVRTIDGLTNQSITGGVQNGANGDSYIYNLGYTFPAGSAYENNLNFGVRVFTVHDPSGTDYVSSFAGTTLAADAVKGYSPSAAGSVVRIDYITIAGVPEPTTLTVGLAAIGLIARRRR